MTATQWLRLFIVCAFALTCAVCFVRCVMAREVRARVGNLAFGWVAGIFWLAQIPYWLRPVTWLTWLTVVGAVLCVGYLVTLVRKGL